MLKYTYPRLNYFKHFTFNFRKALVILKSLCMIFWHSMPLWTLDLYRNLTTSKLKLLVDQTSKNQNGYVSPPKQFRSIFDTSITLLNSYILLSPLASIYSIHCQQLPYRAISWSRLAHFGHFSNCIFFCRNWDLSHKQQAWNFSDTVFFSIRFNHQTFLLNLLPY